MLVSKSTKNQQFRSLRTGVPVSKAAPKDTMFEKAGKYYADWRNDDGKRLRKSFTSKRAALQFEAEQKEATHPKNKALGIHSPKFSAPNSATRPPQTKADTSMRQQSSSSLKLVRSRRKN
jgi:hypothetical protein